MRSLPRLLVLAAAASVALPTWLLAQNRPDAGTTTVSADGGAPTSEQEITIQNLESRLLPIAVPSMRGDASASEVTQVLQHDLHLSALFRVLEPSTFTADLAAEGINISPPPWLQIGATAVVKALVTGGADGARVDVRVWEPGRPATPVLSRSFGPASARAVAHQIANELIRLYTGRAGVFGSRILFARHTGRNRKDVFTVECDGANLSMVSSGHRLNFLPAWGPDGIYYTMQTREGFLSVVRAAQPEPVPIVQIEGIAMAPTFGASHMALVLNRDGNPEIYLASTHGENLQRLTNNSAADVSPQISPDGSRIAFVSDRDGAPQVYVMPLAGGAARRVTFQGDYNQTPSWSPDGSTIVYASRVGGNFDIFTVNVASGAVRRLTEGQGSNSDPTFSPDGRLIAFSSSRGGIFLMNQDGLAQQQVLAGGGETLHWEH